jgi:hypothetical protein
MLQDHKILWLFRQFPESPPLPQTRSSEELDAGQLMKLRFQADYDFNQDIVAGIIRREPGADFQTGHAAGFICGGYKLAAGGFAPIQNAATSSFRATDCEGQ